MGSDDFGQVYDFRRISDVFNLSNRERVIRRLDQHGGMAGYFICIYVFLHGASAEEKEQQKKNSMLAELAVGDTVLTTSGFYGTVIDITDDTVIVEFGSNKNCRIPMQKAAISAVEKPEDVTE